MKNWFSNGKKATVTGKIEVIQQSKYDVSNFDVTIEGLVETSGYHVHMVSSCFPKCLHCDSQAF